MERLPKEERYINGVRRMVPHFPETAIREVIANAMIHQDFIVGGVGPVVEIYENRIEVTNPGNSLIATDRILDERRSRNEKLASTMRAFGLCEERGGGLDKTLIEIEADHLPAPDFISSENSMRVVLFAPRAFAQMSEAEKMQACFFHCVLRWLTHDYMSNATQRERFSPRGLSGRLCHNCRVDQARADCTGRPRPRKEKSPIRALLGSLKTKGRSTLSGSALSDPDSFKRAAIATVRQTIDTGDDR